MEVDKTHSQETSRYHHPSSHHIEPQGRYEEVGHETPAKRHRDRETKEMGYTRREMERMAMDRKQWRSMVDGLCTQRANR